MRLPYPRLLGPVGRAVERLLGPGYMLLTAPDERLGVAEGRFGLAWLSVMMVSAAWALGSMWLYHEVARAFRQYTTHWLPVAAVIIPMAGWLYRRSFVALGQMLGGRDARGQMMVSATALVAVTLCLLHLAWGRPDWPGEARIPHGWHWAYPRAWYRPLILAPMWGAWSMLIAMQFCRPSQRTEPAVAAVARCCRPVAAAGCLVVPLALSLVYLQFLGWGQVAVTSASFISAVGAGVLLCRFGGGLRRDALLAANLLTQGVFLAAFLLSYHG